MEEFHSRMEAVYEAKTVGDLDRLTVDLPEEDLYQLPVPAGQQSAPQLRTRETLEAALPGGLWPWLWGTWGVVSAANLAVWLLLSAILVGVPPAWWIWVAGPWGVIQLGAYAADRKYGRGAT